MKIAQLSLNYYNTEPNSSHAIYSHVAWLCNGLAKENEVTLFASPKSKVDCKIESVLNDQASVFNLKEDIRKYYTQLLSSKCYGSAKNFDIIHSHFNITHGFFSSLVSTPTIASVHFPIDDNLYKIMNNFQNVRYVSFSQAQRKSLPKLDWVGNIYHGVDTEIFSFNPKPKPYLFYLGRVTEQKGVHLAIEAAKAAGMQLIIAGYSYQDEGYWHEKIEKYIDGTTVRYVGEANFEQKIEYLRNATALLFPTQVNEHFGYVMIEAMSCGTPVIGWKNGAVSEVISDKKTGYVVDSVKGMVKAIKNIDKINRRAPRERVEKLFSIEKMVSGYQKVYQRVIDDYRIKNQ
ncbi:MAG: glycosyltransferase family 4 protein [Patescibacteria group bacterium]|jgi:glycosyltransferase involved in cell wall biosynthesis